jgi:hypothetical protein
VHQETLDVTEDDVTVDGPVAARPLVETDPLPDDLRTILEGIAAGVTVQDERGRLLFVNEEAAPSARRSRCSRRHPTSWSTGSR